MAEVGVDIQKAAAFLRQGQLVAIPTETVYGLAGNALDIKSISSIFETKNRPSFDPLILHVASLDRIHPFISEFPEKLKRLAEAFWPGPLTLLIPKKSIIPDLVTSGLDRVAVRVPNHPLSLALLDQLDFPLAAPSANPFGYISPTQAGHVAAQLGAQIPYILDGGACAVGLESTIVGMDEEEQVVIYRLGGLELSKIESLVGSVIVQAHSSSNPSAPGQLASHYAPRKPFVLGNLTELVPQLIQQGKEVGVLSFSNHFPSLPSDRQVVLSATQNLKEAAQRLFMAMRLLDESDAELIVAEFVPETGLGLAINDRLRRAEIQPGLDLK
ncbi:MAG: L-threonylcarbamoyladenylate synthase [Bacteroidetes bacterium]|nr:L-threonylcarbamoyladenylate synthase [Bacteroidota bacterium]MDA1267937.1 L-threonylcarbamoyladenylate synthase [Bacteroidota bacterium]